MYWPPLEKDMWKLWKCNKDESDAKHLLQEEQLSGSNSPQTEKEATWVTYDLCLQNPHWSKEGFNILLSTATYEVGAIIQTL